MGRLFTIYNNKSSKDMDLIAYLPAITPANERYSNIDNNHKDATTYIDLNTREEVVIEQEFEFIEYDINKWNYKYREIKQWLLMLKDNKLRFSDDLGFYYFVNKVELSAPTREAKLNGKFTATFYCDSYVYLMDGLNSIELQETLNNSFCKCKPIYRIEGEGYCTLNVNGNEFKVNVHDAVTIDASEGFAYRDDGENVNTSVTGKYESIQLIEGVNTFSWTEGFSVKIIPNWRCL